MLKLKLYMLKIEVTSKLDLVKAWFGIHIASSLGHYLGGTFLRE